MCNAGKPNVVTPDQPTSRLSQGPAAHSCLVEIEVIQSDLEPVKAYRAPDIIRQ